MAFKDKFKEFHCIDINDALILRHADPEKDQDDFYEIFKNEKVFKYYEGCSTASYDTVKKILLNQVKEFEKARIYSWIIALKDNNKAIGRILLSDFDANNKIANIGYFLNENYWNHGIISACIKPVCDFGFIYLGLERIYSTVHLDNIASWKALEKNGFTREGLLRHAFKAPSGLSDCYIYSKLISD